MGSVFQAALDERIAANRKLARAFSALPADLQREFAPALSKALGVQASAGTAGVAQPTVLEPPNQAGKEALFNALTFNLILPFRDADGVAVAMCKPTRPLTRAEMHQLGFEINTEDPADEG